MFPWISFLSYIIILAYTPGPNNIMSMNNAKNVGFKKGIIFNFGIITGFFVVMILCLIFSSVLYTIIPKIQLPMKILGAAYMVYLIIKIIIPTKEQYIKNNNGSFLIGALLQLINPKIIIYGITAMSSYILPYYKEIQVLIFFAFFLAFMGFTGTICWALFGSLFSILFSKHRKLLNIIMVVLLLYCAVSLFL
ncbi:MAG: LysE family transporter [Treponema sp.]|jgi:threonine/homoserine/homoserine lactone efflux protein|nr:LysE family transporter [Treponema sp.]